MVLPDPASELVCDAQVEHAADVALIGGPAVPAHCLGRILTGADPLVVEDAEIDLACRIARPRGLAEPGERLGVIARNAWRAAEMDRAELSLGRNMPALGRLSKPGNGLHNILRKAAAILEAQPERMLRGGYRRVRGALELAAGQLVIASPITATTERIDESRPALV
jgi:hypothetical protein